MKNLNSASKPTHREFPLMHKGFEIRYALHPEEDVSMERHFMDECGYTQKQFDKIRNYEWFRIELKASLPGDSEVLGRANLGLCCAKDAHAYVTKQDAGGYLPQMLDEVTQDAQKYAPQRVDLLKGLIKNAESSSGQVKKPPKAPSP